MSAGRCEAGERCSCGLDQSMRDKCNLWKSGAAAIKVYGLIAFHRTQKPLIEKHCFGDCGKVSMAGVIEDEHLGGLWVCCEEVCPYLDKQMDEPYGQTMSFGQLHEVYLRTIKDSEPNAEAPPQARSLAARQDQQDGGQNEAREGGE